MNHFTRFTVFLFAIAVLLCACYSESTQISESVGLSIDNSLIEPESSQTNHMEPIPEWKTVYFKLMRDTLNGSMKSRGISIRYGIELYDYDNDGIPELQECYIGNRPDMHPVWFVEGGKACQIIGKIPNSMGDFEIDAFDGIFRHNETNRLMAYYTTGTTFFSAYYYFEPSEDKGIWNLNSMLDIGQLDQNNPTFSCYDEDGVMHDISEHEAIDYKNKISEYSQISGEFLLLESYVSWSDEVARIISDYFDRYDKISSNVAGLDF